MDDAKQSLAIAQPHGGVIIPIRDADTARALQAKSVQARRNNAAKAARSRVTRALAAIDPTIGSSADAWGALVASVAEAVVASAAEGKPRGDDMMQVGRALGVVAQPHEQAQAQSPTGEAAELVTALRLLLDAVVDAQRGQGG